MKKLFILPLTAIVIVVTACTDKDPGDDFILIKGGTFTNSKSNLYGKGVTLSDFYISKYEVTQREWTEVTGNNPSKFKGENLPVETVSWYDCVEYCNQRSLKGGLNPYYNIDKNTTDPDNRSEFDSTKWTVTINAGSNGYRLPTEVEWEYAASGGLMSNSYTYSGSDDVNEVGWYWQNSGDTILTASWTWLLLEKNNCKTKPVGSKKPNELGLYDMSGNVREWCEDWYEDFEISRGLVRVQRGGGWIGAEYRCESSDRHSFEANGKGPDQGFRLCRSK